MIQLDDFGEEKLTEALKSAKTKREDVSLRKKNTAPDKFTIIQKGEKPNADES